MASKEAAVNVDPPKGGDATPTEGNGGASTNESSASAKTDGHLGTGEHVFSDPSIADYWRKKYENAGYENRHRFDPELQWTPEEEKKLVRKVNHNLRRARRSVTDTFCRLTRGLWCGHGSCSALSIFTVEISIVQFPITW